jgi:hypothetical protein
MKQAPTYWRFPAGSGEARIVPFQGRWSVTWCDEDLGSYYSAEDALKRLVGHQTLQPVNGFDLRTLEFPAELSLWQAVDPPGAGDAERPAL